MLNSREKRELKINQRRILMDSIELGIPSPEQILSWGERRLPNGRVVGEVKNSKTVNYKKFTSLKDGLFCERIFGPVNNFVCACGKRQPRIDVKFCEKCEVEYTTNQTRRYRLGYIQLVSATTHIWFLKGRPSYLSLFLGKRKKRVIALAYCNGYLVEQGFPTLKMSSNSFTRKDHGEFVYEGENLNTIKSAVSVKKIEHLSVQTENVDLRSKEWLNNSSGKPSFRSHTQNVASYAFNKDQSPTFTADAEQVIEQSSLEKKVGLYRKRVNPFTQSYHLLPSKFSNVRNLKAPDWENKNASLTDTQLIHTLKGSPIHVLLPKGVSAFHTPSGDGPAVEKADRRSSNCAQSSLNIVQGRVSEAYPSKAIYGVSLQGMESSVSSSASTRVKNWMSSYLQVQTLPFLPTLVCRHSLRDELINYVNSYPLKEDIPLPLYCSENRWRPLRDVHKFMGEQPLRLLEESSETDAVATRVDLEKSFYARSFSKGHSKRNSKGHDFKNLRDGRRIATPRDANLNGVDVSVIQKVDFKKIDVTSPKSEFAKQVGKLDSGDKNLGRHTGKTGSDQREQPYTRTEFELHTQQNCVRAASLCMEIACMKVENRLLYTGYSNLPTGYAIPLANPLTVSGDSFAKQNLASKQGKYSSTSPQTTLDEEDKFGRRSPDLVLSRQKKSVHNLQQTSSPRKEEPENNKKNTNILSPFTHSRGGEKKRVKVKETENLSSIELMAIHEILSYTGGGALQQLLKRYNTHSFANFLFSDLQDARDAYQDRLKMLGQGRDRGVKKILHRICRRIYRTGRRLKVVQLFVRNQRRPEWMILSILPVLPPDLRPILQMSETLVVASDLNNLYQRVIYRNNRYHKLRFIDFNLVTAIQRLVQDAVDRLIENGKGGSKPFYTPGGRPLKSLSDTLKGKKGRFRLNLLGKRVDFSGRSVIVVAPNLKINECGLPREMALELFHYFLVRQFMLKQRGSTIVMAKMAIKQRSQGMWDMLRDLIYHHPVLLNRAPTLHRLGIQAFQPKLVLGSAILLHPLVCSGFNADFDGDQMGVHLPLSFQARAEAWDLLWSRNNMLSPATGQPMLVPSQDMVLGFYYMTTLPTYKIPHLNIGSNQQLYQQLENYTLEFPSTDEKKGSRSIDFKNITQESIDIKRITASANAQVDQIERRLVFHDYHDVLTSFHRGLIRVHTPIWLKCEGAFENNGDLETPLELQINSFATVTQIYAKHKCKIDLSTLSIISFARTSVGRVIVNHVISPYDSASYTAKLTRP